MPIIRPSRTFEGSELPDKGTQAWHEYLDQLNWGPGSRDEASWHAFLRAGSLGIDPDIAGQGVTKRIREFGGTFEPSKIQSQIRRAYEHAGSVAGALNLLAAPPRLQFSSEKLKQFAARAPAVDEAWLVEQSPVKPAAVTSGEFLDSIFLPGEKIAVFTVFRSQGQCVYEVAAPERIVLPEGGADGVWFLSNPVDGHFYPNPRQDRKLSRRSEESITSWRYLVLENDTADSDEWLRALVQFPLKIVAVYTSGGKSIHALVRVDAKSKADWDRIRDEIKPIVVTLGADPGAMTAVRLTRLPGTFRGDRPQRLLYLNPKPDGSPISRKVP